MEHDTKQTVSVWMDTGPLLKESPLSKNARTDVCIVGAGIAGMTTAYLLSKEGKSVIVLDDGPIGGGMTGRTTAHLVNALDDRYFELERLHGEKGARLAAESHTAAIDRVEAIVKNEKIECEFERLRENEWADLYEPFRKTLRALPEFARENLNVAMEYTGLITPGEVDSVAEIEPGRGAIMRRGLTKVAVYKDEAGAAHERSAICRHLGCVVGWNTLESTWDCPCHGSRYDA